MTKTPLGPLSPLVPVSLKGPRVLLEPLARAHGEDLFVSAQDPEIWRWTLTALTDESTFAKWLDAALQAAELGTALPFAIVDRETGKAVGSTRYFDIQRDHRGLEIGHTWLARSAWRTRVNTECKLLLLTHAFDELRCVRVQLKTNVHNTRSRAAIERIGAKFEGVLRKNVVNADGVTYRDSAYYSIVDDEWPEVKSRLTARLRATGDARSLATT